MICGSSTNFLFTTKKNNDNVVDVETPLMIMIQIQKTQHLRVRQQHAHKERNESDSVEGVFQTTSLRFDL